MRYGLVLGVLGMGLLVGRFGRVTGGDAPLEREPRWLTDYARAREAARASGKPIFAVFH